MTTPVHKVVADEDASRPTWALCVATLNRPDILEQSTRLALAQTVPPHEVIIIDASDAWTVHRDRIMALSNWSTIRLVYVHGKVRSITAQRNQALALASAAILFCFDDDTLMHPDCAEQILRVYGLDRDGRIASVAASQTGDLPGTADTGSIVAKVQRNVSMRERLVGLVPAPMRHFFVAEVLLMTLERRFVPYDSPRYPRRPEVPPCLAATGAFAVRLTSGFRLTVRRRVAEQEPFDPSLRAYCPAEDLDVTYRYLRHGQNLQAPLARVYHHEAAANRLKRRKVAELSTLNIAFFVRRSARTQTLHRMLFYIFGLRMLLSCFLRDLVGRRWDLPDTAGTLGALRKSIKVFRLPRANLEQSYIEIQGQILSA